MAVQIIHRTERHRVILGENVADFVQMILHLLQYFAAARAHAVAAQAVGYGQSVFLQRRAAAACNLSCIRSIYRAVKLQYTVPRHALLQKRIRCLLGERRIIKSNMLQRHIIHAAYRAVYRQQRHGGGFCFAQHVVPAAFHQRRKCDCVHLIHDQRTHGFNLCLLRALDRHFQHFEAMFLRRMYKRFGLRFAPVILCRRGDNAEHRHMGILFFRLCQSLQQPQHRNCAEQQQCRPFPSLHGFLSVSCSLLNDLIISHFGGMSQMYLTIV